MANVKNANNILIGTGILYINGESVGQLSGDVTFKSSEEVYKVEAGNPKTTVKQKPVSEGAEITAGLLEVGDLDNLARLMPKFTKETTEDGTANVTDESITVRAGEWTPLAHGELSAVTVTDTEGTELTEGTDYRMDYIYGRITRVGTSVAIADGDEILVDYTHATHKGTTLWAGGNFTTATFTMKFVHTRDDGSTLNIEFFKASLSGNMELPFSEDEASVMSVTITALSDSTKPVGKQLYKIEDLDAA